MADRLKDLVKRVYDMHGKVGNFSRDLGNIKSNGKSRKKNQRWRISSRCLSADQTKQSLKKKISELEDRAIESRQSTNWKKKRKKKIPRKNDNENTTTQNLWDAAKAIL